MKFLIIWAIFAEWLVFAQSNNQQNNNSQQNANTENNYDNQQNANSEEDTEEEVEGSNNGNQLNSNPVNKTTKNVKNNSVNNLPKDNPQTINNALDEEFSDETTEEIQVNSNTNNKTKPVTNSNYSTNTENKMNQANANSLEKKPEQSESFIKREQNTPEQNKKEFEEYFKKNIGGRPEGVYRIWKATASIYTDADDQSEVVGTLERDDLVHAIEQREGWIKIGNSEWVKAADARSLGLKTKGLVLP